MMSFLVTPAALLPLVSFFIMGYFCDGRQSPICPKDEREALLTFKHSLKNFSRLSSWNGEIDCCKWNGVVCNNLTGHVHELDLRGYGLNGSLHSSLLDLKHLAFLELSSNKFNENIPSFIESFTRLEHLDLYDAGFYGSVPHTIGNLSRLRSLSLGSYVSKDLNVDNFAWLSKLSQLEDLSMQYVDLGTAMDWVQVINSLPSLVNLSLSNCNLDFTTPPNTINITTSLAHLNLSYNFWSRSSDSLSWIFQIKNLVSLDLRMNLIRGQIPTMSNITNLQKLDLSVNNFNSSIPNWIYSCKRLEYLDFSGNSGLRTKIFDDIKNLSSLKALGFYDTGLSGNIPDLLGNMTYLEILDLSDNQLDGEIPTSLGKLSSLWRLRLGHNKLTGNLPQSLGQLSNLEEFSFGDNMLKGVVTENHFANLTKLKSIVAERNHLTLKVNPNWVPPFKLEILRLGSWNVGTSIPSWIQTQTSIQELDLSETGVSGTVPDWVWKADVLDLSDNQLHGTVPNIIPPQVHSYSVVRLRSNNFNGSLPRVRAIVTELDLSNNSFSGDVSHIFCDTENTTYNFFWILDLSNNNLSGALPADCWTNWRLRVLRLGNNNLHGSIPSSLAFGRNLVSLHLNNNKISGTMPLSLLNYSNLLIMDLSHNDLEGNILRGLGTSLRNLAILILQSNKLSGELFPDICQLNFLQILDLSNNNFSGKIPTCVGNFTALVKGSDLQLQYWLRVPSFSLDDYPGMESAHVTTNGREFRYDTILVLVTNIDLSNNNFSGGITEGFTSLVLLRSLNLSDNHLTGSIPNNIGDMKQLETLDLSINSFSGEIPSSLRVLSFINHLNLSYNNFTGRIPESTQLLGLDPSSFIGNDLCGPPLTNSCGNDHRDRVPTEGNGGKTSEIRWVYVFLSLGYAMGFSVACSVLVLKKSWREVLFGFVEEAWDWIYVYFHVKWRRLARRWGWRED